MARFKDSRAGPGPPPGRRAASRRARTTSGDRCELVRGGRVRACSRASRCPPSYHWSRAAGQRLSGDDRAAQQFRRPRPDEGRTQAAAMNRFGAVDLAGNVKEWCWNRADATRRYILGGAWDEPVYMFNDPDARSPFERAATLRVSLRQVLGGRDAGGAPTTSSSPSRRATSARRQPVTRRACSRPTCGSTNTTSADLAAKPESPDDSHPDWRVERVSFAGGLRRRARAGAVYFCQSAAGRPIRRSSISRALSAITQRSSAQINPRLFDWMIKSGRAVIFPIYKSTYERGDGLDSPITRTETIACRDHVIAWAKDVRRAVDYLESQRRHRSRPGGVHGPELGRRDGAGLSRRGAAIQGGGPDRRRVLRCSTRCRKSTRSTSRRA